MTPSGVILEARGIAKSFGGVRALAGADIAVRRGRLNALLGENGAGKSTLMAILAGALAPDRGEIRLDGRPVRFRDPREARAAGIAIIFQELSQVPGLSIAENIFLGREPVNALGLVDPARRRREAAAWLARLEVGLDPDLPVASLRVGERQMVEIAKALSLRARVLILDEPTSALSAQEAASLFRQIRRLKEDGVGLIYITHRLDELPGLADDVTILRDGAFVAARPFAEIDRSEMIRLMVGRDLSGLYARARRAPGAEALRVEGLSLPHPRRPGEHLLQGISLSVRAGEVVGIFGLMGAGRTELLETLFGRRPASAGTAWIGGAEGLPASPRAAIRAGLALVPEDRKDDGLVLGMSIAENMGLAGLARAGGPWWLRPGRERAEARAWGERLRLKAASTRQPARQLSGGNQQKVVLAKGLATGPRVLLLDEPTRGIDLKAKREIYGLIDGWVAEGLAVLLVSSELPEILAVADRILVLCEGRLSAEFAAGEATEEALLRAAVPEGAGT
ncbi:MAG TPA: sugar ABC transporter ATP-binding protein [Opitutaceae bacterium]|nr:sugar ABC transporter ATP-binding protein [Opitutaceae bacterium]